MRLVRFKYIVGVSGWIGILSFISAPTGAAELPENLAPKARVWASSEYSRDYVAANAVDGKVPPPQARKDIGAAWCCLGAKVGDKAEFSLEWGQPVDVAEVVYWGRTGVLLSECWKDYELYVDSDAQPVAKGRLRMVHGPQRIAVGRRAVRKVSLRFLSGYEGGQNHGASEIAVYSPPPSDEQLDWFPLAGAELEEKIRQVQQERAPLRRVAEGLPGKVVFLAGSQPRNSVDWNSPTVWQEASGQRRQRDYMGGGAHTYRCYVEKDSPGPATMGHQLYVLDPADTSLRPRLLLDAGSGWIGGAMSASYDGKSLYFAMAPQGDSFFHIYRMSLDGGQPEQLTRGPFRDMDPDILPDGRIVFSSTRFGSREEYHGYLVSTLFTMGPGGEDIRPLTYHVVSDREPKVTASGDIVFVRQDNFFMNAKVESQIHHIRGDGRGGDVLLGQDREGSGYSRDTMHEGIPTAIGFLAPSRLHYKRHGSAVGCPAPLPDGRVAALSAATLNWSPQYPFQQHGIGIVLSGGATTDGQPVPTSEPLHDISPLPDGRLLCATMDQTALGVVDVRTGQVERFHVSRREAIHAPLYVGPRTKPKARPAASLAPDTGRETGFFYCQNVLNTKQVHADLDRIRAVRVLEGRPLTVRMLACNAYEGGVNHIGTEGGELGVVPLCPDGSFFIEAPADRALAFQAIDAEGRAVINELSWVYVRPGEHRSCVGCHAQRADAPQAVRGQALDHAPLRLTGEAGAIRYKANALAWGGVTGSNLDRVRETKSINLYPYPAPRSDTKGEPLAPGRATTVRALCERMKMGSDAERVSAAQHLGVLRDRSAGPALCDALSHPQVQVRTAAAMALAACGDRAATAALARAVGDEDLHVGLAARAALSHLTGHSEELEGVGPAARRACAERWSRWLAANDWSAVEKQLIERLADRDPQRVVAAVQALGHVGGQAGRVALRALAQRAAAPKDRTDLHALVEALRGLGQLSDDGAIPVLKNVLEMHLTLPKGMRSTKLAEAAAEAVGRVGSQQAQAVLLAATGRLKRFWEYNLALGDQGGGWGDYLSCSPVHYRFLEAFDAMGARLDQEAVLVLVNSLPMSFDQPLLLELDTYETMLARVVQRSGCLESILGSCFAMLGVETGAVNEAFRSSLLAQVATHKYPQMSGSQTAFTVPQRVAHLLAVLGMRPEDAPRYRQAFDRHRQRYQLVRRQYRGLEAGACAWVCFYSLETLGRLRAGEAYETLLQALADPPEAADGLPGPTEQMDHLATTPHYRAAAAFALGRLGNRQAVPALLEAVKNFDNALEVRHWAARALGMLCGKSDAPALRQLAEDYPEVVTRRVLLRACEQAELRP